MRLRTDENLGRAELRLLTLAGHDVATVHPQATRGAPDGNLPVVEKAYGGALPIQS